MGYGLYVHVPFCKAKCKYCDFLSFPCMDSRFSEYVDALIKEIEATGVEYAEKSGCLAEIDSVFVGGGTPSLLSESDFKRLFDAVNKNFNICDNAEITVEANPATVSLEKLSFLRNIGVNRLSLGFQSLDNDTLRFLGRIHGAEDAIKAFKDAGKAGFDNINVDLIFGMPYDDRKAFEDTLEKVISLSPEHISCYSLIIEEKTPLFEMVEKGEIPYPDEIFDREDYAFCKERLCNAGYGQYEISNFSKKGFESRHNLKYWRQEEYFGVGLGSASFIGNRRFANCGDFSEYVEKSPEIPLREDILLSSKELADEFLMLGFRTLNGPDLRKFREKFGAEVLEEYREKFERLSGEGLIKTVSEGKNIFGACLTEKGLDLANLVFEEFV